MDVLQDNFSLLFCLGMWKPVNLTDRWKSFLFYIYSSVVTFMSYWFLITEVIGLVVFTKNIEDFVANVFFVTALFTGCMKVTCFHWKRDRFIDIVNGFKKGFFEPQSSEELNIWKKCARTNRRISIYAYFWLLLGCESVTVTVFSPKVINNRLLVFQAWLPYDYTASVLMYWVTSLEQLITVHILGAANFSFNLIFYGIMLNICVQIKILKLRYKKALTADDSLTGNPPEKLMEAKKFIKVFTDCHVSIIKQFKLVHSLFSTIVTIQYFVSAVTLCTTAYNFTKEEFGSYNFFFTIFFIKNIMIELFLLCVSSNEVTHQFSELTDAFYDCEWYSINNHSKTSIAIMMTNTMQPINFTCAYVINLSLESFTRVIKVSYSVFSVLQSVQ